jgi:hypothetical protein
MKGRAKMATKKPKPTEKRREQIEYDRLSLLYQRIPANKRELVDGLIVQAARLRVSLDDLWEDIQKNGNTEMFKQANDGVEFPRERPESKIFAVRDKSYLAIIKKLDELLPAQEVKSGFSKLDD